MEALPCSKDFDDNFAGKSCDYNFVVFAVFGGDVAVVAVVVDAAAVVGDAVDDKKYPAPAGRGTASRWHYNFEINILHYSVNSETMIDVLQQMNDHSTDEVKLMIGKNVNNVEHRYRR